MRSLATTRHAPTAALFDTLARLAPTPLPLLLEGETGAGKSFLAERIHRAGRPGRPLVVVDCAAVPPTLLASELFGHAPGAFTDALRARAGCFERAGDGTVVLDRVDLLAPESQVVLLRVLEERRFIAVGGSTPRPLAARVIATASEGVSARIGDSVRADLYHRLAGFHATLVPLRERNADILPFARALLARRRRRLGPLELAAETATLLAAYPWPGNFRELGATLERACLLAEHGRIDPAHLGLPLEFEPVARQAASRGLPLEQVQRVYALMVLAAQDGNVSRAARVLGVSRRTLIRWRSEA